MPAPAVGIDLGTTNSAMSYVMNGEPVMAHNNQGNEVTPSVVHFDRDLVVIGEEAVKKRKTSPRNNIANIKRLMGSKHDDLIVRQDSKRSFEVMRGRKNRATIRVGSEVYTPQEISAFILKYMKTIATKMLLEEPTDAVITVPANFTNAQREATRDAGRIAGFNVLQIVNEPTAAAIAYGALTKCEEVLWRVLVYDLGGGTFDVSIVEIEGKETKVLATDGCAYLGGTDFDDRIYEEAQIRFREMGIEISENDWILRDECEVAKKALSSQESVRISHIGYRGRGFDFTRARFNTLCADLFDRTISLTDKVLSEAAIDEASDYRIFQEYIDEIMLVGGSTYIKKIRELLRERFPDNVIRDSVEPELAVAKGAAILAAALSKNSSLGDTGVPRPITPRPITLVDVTPLPLGLRVNRNRCKLLIKKNTRFPFSTYELCSNFSDNDTTITLEIMEGDQAQASVNRTLARVNIDVLPKPRGQNMIMLCLSIDVNGILSVSATDNDTKNEVTVTVANMRKAVGIDLGTTYSCIACMKNDTTVEVVRNQYADQFNNYLQIIEGQHLQSSENTLLGTCSIRVPKRKIGQNNIITTFSVDENGILSVHLHDVDTKVEASTRVQTSKYTEEERMELVRNTREEEELEKIERAKYEARTVFADAMLMVKRSVDKTDSKKTKVELQKLVASEDKWIKSTKLSNEEIIARAASVNEKLAKIMK